MPFFSIIIATRNRPTLFRAALHSALNQCGSDAEIIVVNDGSETGHRREYDRVLNAVEGARIRSFHLPPKPNGHGAAYARNFGAAASNAPYLCFLDDDDYFTDPEHLSRAQVIIFSSAAPVDLYMTNQAAFLNGVKQPGPMWIEDMPTILEKHDNRPDWRGAYIVSVEALLRSQGFCHLNTLIVRRALYDVMGGMEETIRYEEDRDFYLRAIDRATTMLYTPVCVARHNIPDARKSNSASLALSDTDRRRFQLMVFDRAWHRSRNSSIRAYGRRHKAYTLKRITESLAAEGRYADAAFYAREALRTDPTLKWGAYTVWRMLRALAG